MTTRTILTLFFSLFIVTGLRAEAPVGLLTDLLEHTDRVWLDGYPSTVQLHELGKTVERYRTATIFSEKPAFSWIVADSRKDVLQTAYQILVGTDRGKLDKDDADLWNSGRIESDDSVAVLYAGKPLPPKMVVYWKVKTWNNDAEQPFSDVKAFLTGDELVPYQTARYPLQKTEQTPEYLAQRGDRFFVDFGKAAFAQLRLTLTSDVNDHAVTIHFGEACEGDPRDIGARINRKPGGTIRYAAYSLRLQKGTHTYRIKFRPDGRNTGGAAIKMPDDIGEVYPFRYVELENVPLTGLGEAFQKEVTEKFKDEPTTPLDEKHLGFLPASRGGTFGFGNTITREIVHYPFDDTASDFRCDNDILNRVWEMCKYSIKATSFCGVYVDGDRERIPYEADALINQLCHYGVDREYSMARYSHEYLLRHATWPTEWILQSVLMAYSDYLYTGDRRSAEAFYADLQAKLLLPLADPVTGLLSTKTGRQTPELLKAIHFGGKELRDIVDWPHTGILGLGKSEGGETDGFVFTDYNAVVNAYHYQALVCMAFLAGELGKTEDAETYAKSADRVKESFNRAFYDSARQHYRDGIGTDHASLHANLFPLVFGMVPKHHTDREYDGVMDYVRSRGMACSVYGAQFLLDAIYTAEAPGYGLNLLASQEERSWFNMIRAGSTISMESWDNKYKPNQDWNHAWGAAPANIIPRKLMGVEPLEPGFRMVRIKPQIASLEFAEAKIPTIRGPIVLDVRKDKEDGKELVVSVSIPANMRAVVELPCTLEAHETFQITVDGEKVEAEIVGGEGAVPGRFLRIKNPVGSGEHRIELRKVWVLQDM